MEHILRSEDVELADQVALHTSLMPISSTDGPLDQSQTQARIVETHADHVVIEAICACGNKIHIRCDF